MEHITILFDENASVDTASIVSDIESLALVREVYSARFKIIITVR